MRFSKIILIFSLALFGVIGLFALLKKKEKPEEVVVVQEEVVSEPIALPDADLMDQFFSVSSPKLPVVKTVTYSRKVPWLEGKAAWVGDYANHYHTSRHFIARSLNGTRDYEKQDIANGDCFNVYCEERPINFHLVVDISRCRMWVYYHDETTDERVLVKSYRVGLGRSNERLVSGLLTPLGTYQLGDKIAVYRSGTTGIYNGESTKMVQVFGTRWIPFDQPMGECTAPPKGLGLHGCPWVDGEEDASGLGVYGGDGCVRLSTEDMEELFAVIITRPTQIHLVSDFFEAKLPGRES